MGLADIKTAMDLVDKKNSHTVVDDGMAVCYSLPDCQVEATLLHFVFYVAATRFAHIPEHF